MGVNYYINHHSTGGDQSPLSSFSRSSSSSDRTIYCQHLCPLFLHRRLPCFSRIEVLISCTSCPQRWLLLLIPPPHHIVIQSIVSLDLWSTGPLFVLRPAETGGGVVLLTNNVSLKDSISWPELLSPLNTLLRLFYYEAPSFAQRETYYLDGHWTDNADEE